MPCRSSGGRRGERKKIDLLGSQDMLAEGLGYAIKRRLLGPPLVNEQLSEERLSKRLALGVLSCDGISSAAYGTEEMLIELLPVFGLAGFALIIPMTGVVLLGIALVVLLYREVVSVYTRAGGSYVVARESFGPRIAQVAAVALLIDYVVTVAVQVAAGSAAIVSAFPSLTTALGLSPKVLLLIISVVAILIMCYGNLRGVREAGRAFALPTYLFSGSVGLMIIFGLYREASAGGLPQAHPAPPGPNGTVGNRSQHLRIAHRRRYLCPVARVRQRRFLTHRDRSRVQRGQRAAKAGRQERPRGAGDSGHHRGVPDRGHLLAGAHHARDPVQPGRADGAGSGGQADLRHQRARPDSVLHGPGRDGRDLVHRRQHQLQRVPLPGQLRGRGFVPATLADQARSPAGLLQRHHRADRRLPDLADRGRCQRQPPDPVLRDRGLHRVHDGRFRHGQVLPAAQRRPAGSTA